MEFHRNAWLSWVEAFSNHRRRRSRSTFRNRCSLPAASSGIEAGACLEELENRLLLTDLIGVDFGAAGDVSPTNWNSSAGNGGANFVMSNLIDEAGNATVVDLVVTYDGGTGVGAFLDRVPVAGIPDHTNPLTEIHGILVDESELSFVFAELDSTATYEVFVFGGVEAASGRQNITVSGASTLPVISQVWNQQLFVNGDVGSSARSLSEYSVQMMPNSSGQLSITVAEGSAGDEAAVPALAIREVPPLPPLVGIDFGAAGDMSPVNWNSSEGNNGTDYVIDNLIDESGDPTTIDLAVAFVDGLGTGASTPAAAFIPAHSNSLANIGGLLLSERSIEFTFSGLVPGNSYDLFVFGGDDQTDFSQTVTITGQTAAPAFVQDWNNNQYVNDQVASTADLQTFATKAIADSNGHIEVFVEESSAGDFAVVPALAIRGISEEPVVAGEFVGIDFDVAGGVSPINWTSVTALVPPQQITNLIDETGVATGIDLTIATSAFGADPTLGPTTLPSGQIPTHSNSLLNLDGAFAFGDAVMFTFDDLDVASDYEVYVFGGLPQGFPAATQSVTIVGDGASVEFDQSWNESLHVNGLVGSNAALDSFAATVSPSSSGRISVLVDRSALLDFVAVAGIALRPIQASPRAERLTVSISDPAIDETDFENATTVTITRPGSTASSLDVTLTSSDISEVTVQPAVTIPVGQSSVTVDLTAVFDGVFDGHQVPSIIATAAGFAPANDQLFVVDNDFPLLSVQVPGGNRALIHEILETDGADAYTLQVSRNTEDVSTALSVNLTNEDPTEITIPATVTIPAGESSVLFTIGAVDDALADGTQKAGVTGTAAGFSSQSGFVYVDDDDAPQLTVSFSATSVAEGARIVGTVTRNTPAEDDLPVALLSSNTSQLQVPSTVTIPAGQASVTFDVDGVNDVLADGTQNVVVTATDASVGLDARLDAGFGIAGRVFPNLRNNVARPATPDLVLQPDGKVVTFGLDADSSDSWRLQRYNVDGTPDTTFGVNGTVTTAFTGSGSLTTQRLRLLPDGRIVAMGYSTVLANTVARYLADGSLDTTLDTDGILNFPRTELRSDDFTVAPDGSMYFISDAFSTAVRLQKFSDTGNEVYSVTAALNVDADEDPVAIERQSDGKLLVIGGASPADSNDLLMLIRFNEDGTLDDSFSDDGLQTFDSGTNAVSASLLAATFQPDGKIVAVGFVPPAGAAPNHGLKQWIVMRYNTDGTLDTTFSGDGIDVPNYPSNAAPVATEVVVQPDGKIVVMGLAGFFPETVDTYDRVIHRYNGDGTFDDSFGDDGVQILNPTAEFLVEPKAAALQTDGQLLMLSMHQYNARLERYDLSPTPVSGSASVDVTDDDVNADLVGTSFNVTNDHVVTGIAGVSFTIQNIGAVPTTAFDTHIVWSANDQLGDADDVIVSGSTLSFGALGVGAFATRNFNLTLDKAVLFQHALAQTPGGGPVGTVSTESSRLFLVIDVGNTVAENDETNNSGVGHGIDSDDFTYFPWDKNRNGVVEPLEALTTIQSINTADSASDFDGRGIVTPLKALSAVQRIGYLRNEAVSTKSGASGKLKTPTVSSLNLLKSSREPSVAVEDVEFPAESTTGAAPFIDVDRDDLFATDDSEFDRPPELQDSETATAEAIDDEFAQHTDWLSMI